MEELLTTEETYIRDLDHIITVRYYYVENDT